MSNKHLFSQAALIASLVLLSIKPDSIGLAIVVIATCALIGFLHFLDRSRADEIKDVERELNARITEIKNKLDVMALGKGLHR